jgi:hypothetical protein
VVHAFGAGDRGTNAIFAIRSSPAHSNQPLDSSSSRLEASPCAVLSSSLLSRHTTGFKAIPEHRD